MWRIDSVGAKPMPLCIRFSARGAQPEPAYPPLHDSFYPRPAPPELSLIVGMLEALRKGTNHILTFWENLKERLLPGYLHKRLEAESKLLFFPNLDSPPEAEPVSQNPREKPGFPAHSTQYVPIAGIFQRRGTVRFQDDKLGWHRLSKYGDLSKNGALWLEDRNGNVLGTLRREKYSQLFGEIIPKRFFPLALEVEENVNAAIGDQIKAALLDDAVAEARQLGFRVAINPPKEQRPLLQRCGLVTLQEAVNEYVPRNSWNLLAPNHRGYRAFDGTLGARHQRYESLTS